VSRATANGQTCRHRRDHHSQQQHAGRGGHRSEGRQDAPQRGQRSGVVAIAAWRV
jgi:hypothetical protein